MPADSSNVRVKLVLSDVDGTLLDPQKNLTPGAPAAVRALRQAGIRFTLASARPPQLTLPLLRDLHVSEPSACFNGGLLIAPDGKVLHQLPLLVSDAQTVADHICKCDLDLWVYAGNHWYVSNAHGPHVAHQEGLMQSKATTLTSYDMSHYHVLKLVGVSDDEALMERAEADLKKLHCVAISATRSSPYYLDVTHLDANKGQVVITLSKMLGIPTGQIATIGDMETDALMFHRCGVSVAMGNATDKVKAQAKYVTRSNEEDGFAYGMQHFILDAMKKEAAAD